MGSTTPQPANHAIPIDEPEADARLVAQAQQQLPYDATAFALLVRRYEPTVYRMCAQYLNSPYDAEEVTQDVFLRVFHGLPRFEGRSSFRTWLFRIARNESATRYRKLKVRQERGQTYADAERQGPPSVVEPVGIDSGYHGVVGQVLDQLGESDREVLILRHVAELSFDELAEVLGVSLSAAKMRLYRAEERFRGIADPPL